MERRCFESQNTVVFMHVVRTGETRNACKSSVGRHGGEKQRGILRIRLKRRAKEIWRDVVDCINLPQWRSHVNTVMTLLSSKTDGN
jgi:hypothetical protein